MASPLPLNSQPGAQNLIDSVDRLPALSKVTVIERLPRAWPWVSISVHIIPFRLQNRPTRPTSETQRGGITYTRWRTSV